MLDVVGDCRERHVAVIPMRDVSNTASSVELMAMSVVPAGVGAVDAGMIGTFVLFGFPEEQVFAAVLIYRLVAFWLPIPPGVAAFFQLRKTVKRWKRDGLPIDRPPKPGLIEEIL